MKKSTRTTFLGCLFVTLAGSAYTTSVSADAVGDCRQQAQDYGYTADELDDYIEGCLASLGELIVEEEVAVDYAPPVEMDDEPVPQADDAGAAQ